MADDDVIEVVVPQDAASEETVKPGKPAKPAKPASDAPSPEAAVEALKKQLADKDAEAKTLRESDERSRKAAIEAEQRARIETGKAQASERIVHSAELDSVTNALAAANREAESLEQQLKQAHEAGEFGTVSKLSVQIAKIGGRIAQLEDGKTVLEERAKQQPAKPVPQSAEEQREAFIASRTPATAAWLRANPRFFSDTALRAKIEAADGTVAVIEGIARDTPDYFRRVEELAGIRQVAEPAASTAGIVVDRTSAVEEPPPRQAAPSRAAAMPAAPPSREAPNARADSVGGIKVQLSREERDAAQWLHPRQKPDDPDPEVVYARNKLALIKEGRLLGADGRPTGPR